MRAPVLALLALTLAGGAAEAQCPDGSQPPCRSARPAVAARRPDPPLDDRTWIVVPFNNVTRTPDVDYLRDASVNLLYLDMSRWSDIRVVDDARVVDLLKEVPEARTMPLSLEAATAVAKRAGAGRMVMGNIIKQGARTTLAAKVFDVRRGAVLRSPQQDLIVQDSLMAVFGKLAVAILNVAAPAGTKVADVGTTRVDAYQEYLAGSAALKRFDLVAARTHLTQALKLDSAFALAHYKLAILIGWDTPADNAKATHAAAAARLSTGLPPRERTLMKGLNEFQQAMYAISCATYGSLITADSSDVEALYGVGECSFHDDVVIANPADTSRRVFRTGRNAAIRAFERVVELDPTYHLAYQHILDALSGERRNGVDRQTCPAPGAVTQRCFMSAIVRRSGDSLITIPVNFADSAGWRAQSEEAIRTNTRRMNLELARDRARAWVGAAPDESRAHLELGHLYTLLGSYAEAEAQFAQVTGPRTATEVSKMMPDRIEIGIKLWRGEAVRRLVDSLITAKSAAAGVRPVGVLVGRMAVFDSAMRSAMARQPNLPPVVADFSMASIRGVMTGGDARLDSLEKVVMALSASSPTGMPRSPTSIIPYIYAPRRPRTWMPFEYSADPRASALVALAKGDTARLRAELRAIDNTQIARTAPDSGAGVMVAELYLALGDSVSALRSVRRMLDSTLVATHAVTTPLFGPVGLPTLVLWPRLSLLRADLELAAGNKDAARVWYRRFVDLWTDADAEFLPIVARARQSLAALGPP